MTTHTVRVSEAELERRIAAFEAAWADGGSVELASFLPPHDAADFPLVLSELIRVDLEFRYARGESPRLHAYRSHAPQLFRDARWLGELAFEEYRQRIARGETPEPSAFAVEYGVNVSGWPKASVGRATTAAFPEIGACLGSFRLLGELGRGSFGRVYLAEQLDLAGRRVALKVSTRFAASEPETLARLQHTNIVPIYSTSRIDGLQLIAMPFLGSTTLADVLTALRSRGHWPKSGQAIVETLTDRASKTKASQASTTTPTEPPQTAPPNIPLERLRALSYPDAVLWLGDKLAQALAHAHDRGILHRDVKPANILLTDDGEPMLLDFNLARDAGDERTQGMGGTPAYMAPEQRAAMTDRTTAVDTRADLYSLGLVLAELLIGRSPVLADGRLEALRPLNPGLASGTEAIVLKCLAAKPGDRYATARELSDEIHRHLTHQPLLATRVPSLRERLSKWRKRHPRLTSAGSVGAVAAVVVVALIAGLSARQRHVAILTKEREAATKLQESRKAVPAVQDRLASPQGDRAEGETALDALLARYGLPTEADWWNADAVARLPSDDRTELQRELAELQLLKARKAMDWDAMLRWNEAARVTYVRVGFEPQIVWRDRGDFARRFGRDAAEFDALTLRIAPAGRDWYLSGLTARDAGNFAEAERDFRTATALDPTQEWSWLALGDVLSVTGRDAEAAGCFQVAVALKPHRFMAYFNRGMSRSRLKEYDAADEDFTKVLALKTDHREARIQRGSVRLALRRYEAAEADWTAVLDGADAPTHVYFLRAEVRRTRGDKAGAERDYAQGVASTPTDERSWIVRGSERVKALDFEGALRDFYAAIGINPRSHAALMNKANVQDEHLHCTRDSIATLDVLLTHHPHLHMARAGRAVLLARLGKRAEAHADAVRCLKENPEPDIVYQLAGVYAQTSRTHPEDTAAAYELLKRALARNTGPAVIPIDPDLAPLRDKPEFRAIVAAATTLAPKPPR